MSTTTQKHRHPGQQVDAHTPRKPIAGQPPATAPSPAGEITRESIQARAYQIYQARNGNGGAGDATSDWLQAERELNGAAPEPSAATDIEVKSRARGETLLAGGK